MLVSGSVKGPQQSLERNMILSHCATLMETARNQGADEETCILKAHAYLDSQSLKPHEIEFAMNDVRTIAAKLFETEPA